MMIASSSNGRTADSDSVNLGSSPGEAAIKNPRVSGVFLALCRPTRTKIWFGIESWRARGNRSARLTKMKGAREKFAGIYSPGEAAIKNPASAGFFYFGWLIRGFF